MHTKLKSLVASCSLALITLPAMARSDDHASGVEPMKDVNEAVRVVQQMKADAGMASLLRDCKGVLVLPDYAAAALIAGGSGGEGVLLAHQDGKWSAPVFFNMGKISVGLQAGVSAGSIAMVLMSDRALNSFEGENTFSLTADAGLSIVNWSKKAEADVGKGHDVVVWTDTEGLLGKASVGVSDISRDDSENRAYYGRRATTQQILQGKVDNPHPDPLKGVLSSL